MASCGSCGREVIWAVTGQDKTAIILDKTTEIRGEGRYALDFPEGGGRPTALRLSSDREFPAHTAHEQTCGQPYGGF